MRMAVLGDLEEAVMALLWRRSGPVSVREVQESLNADRPLAYTTVMTVLDRLAKKGIVGRELEGRAWLYRAAVSRADLLATEIVGLLRSGTADEQRAVWDAVTERMGPLAG